MCPMWAAINKIYISKLQKILPRKLLFLARHAQLGTNKVHCTWTIAIIVKKLILGLSCHAIKKLIRKSFSGNG